MYSQFAKPADVELARSDSVTKGVGVGAAHNGKPSLEAAQPAPYVTDDDSSAAEAAVFATPATALNSGLDDANTVSYAVPSGSCGWWLGWLFGAAALLTAWIMGLILLADADADWDNLRFRFVGVGDECSDHICFISIGQVHYELLFARGFITIGQVGIGLVNLSQVGFGVFAALGQAQASFGVAIGQAAFATWVPACQFGVTLARNHFSMLALNLVNPFRRVDGEQQPLVLKCPCNRARRSPRRRTRFMA